VRLSTDFEQTYLVIALARVRETGGESLRATGTTGEESLFYGSSGGVPPEPATRRTAMMTSG